MSCCDKHGAVFFILNTEKIKKLSCLDKEYLHSQIWNVTIQDS